jgi:gamma-glutamyltranspeptidase/glutathione hydrolase
MRNFRRFFGFVPAALLVAAAASPVAAQRAGGGGAGAAAPAQALQAPPMVESQTGLVVSVNGLASDIGAAILKKGGNAVDAAVATAFALAVVHPAAGNIGGGGFMVVRAANGSATTFDYRERAPGASTERMYLGPDGRLPRPLPTAAGYTAPGVPGTVRGMAMAHKKFGKLKWEDVVMPSVTLAEKGFVLSSALARSISGEVSGRMQPYPASVKAYGKPGGGAWAAGDTIVLADLGKTLRAIATKGADVFYTGWIADSIATAMKANGGLITKKDLADYQAKERAPIKGTYRGYDIISMPPPSSGGTAIVQMLNILENYDLPKWGWNSAQTQHVLIEAMRRAYLDRARHLGDPDFVKVPVDRLTSKAYAKTLVAGIDPNKSSRSAELGADILGQPLPGESDETTHFSVIDKDGMAVSNTYTLEGSYGSHVVVSGTGMILNNEMGDFNKTPGLTDSTGSIGTPANLIRPGKRMLSSMSPTIVAKDGKPFLVTGSPGGRTIIGTTLDVILHAVDFGANARMAVDGPRLHHQWMPDMATYERNALSEPVMKALTDMGHRIGVGSGQGDAHSIMYDAKTKTAFGAADDRSSDSKASKPQ